MKKLALIGLAVMATVGLTACEHEVGSDRWCKAMKAKDKADWSANEAADYLKHCVIEVKEQ
ncbi:MAG: DUF3012 domain-containing protein [Kangiellaceae bacterium]|nr:DUF3012 domain-containing protein [Kangiellaceae bacterium]